MSSKFHTLPTIDAENHGDWSRRAIYCFCPLGENREMPDHSFEPMRVNGQTFHVTKKKPFSPNGQIRSSTIETVLKFAFDMTYGSKGQHRDHRSGGTAKRSNAQIMSDTYQGKLSEFALANILYKLEGFIPPDTSTYDLGEWESADFQVGVNHFSVKSTKYFGNLLLLEKRDWDAFGRYLPTGENPKSYTHIVLVRISPDIEELISPKSSSSEPSYEKLLMKLLDRKWEYEITGYITSEDLMRIMKMGHLIPRGALLNGKVRMDATNFYVQAADLRSFVDLKKSLNLA